MKMLSSIKNIYSPTISTILRKVSDQFQPRAVNFEAHTGDAIGYFQRQDFKY